MFRRLFFTAILTVLAACYVSTNAQAATARIAILFPDVSEVHGHLFQGLIEGIKSVSEYEFDVIKVTEATTQEDIIARVKKQNIAGVIALGQTSYKLAETLNDTMPVVAGGMVVTPPGVTGISLTADPEAFLRNLQILSPGVVNVHLVYTDASLGWLMDRIKSTAEKYGVTLQAYRAENAKDAIGYYKTALDTINAKNEALWLPLDNTVPYNLLMPTILQTAWERDITVFSNNIQHARQGVLFALYPDPYKQGRRLVSILTQRLDSKKRADILLTSVDVKVAVNVRTATHLKLKYTKPILDRIDQIYPAIND